MKKFVMPILCGVVLSVLLSSCVDNNKGFGGVTTESTAGSLYIINSGNTSLSNSSLSIYKPKSKEVQNQLFSNANNQSLGDTAYSMKMNSSLGWIVVSNSDVIYAISPGSAQVRGRITGFSSPRNIHFVSSNKAYVTQGNDPRICIVNPQNYTITGHIDVRSENSNASTEQMVQIGDFVYVTCWLGQEQVLKINTSTDEVVGSLNVGLQPRWMVVDRNNKLWVLTDGGDQGGKNQESPRLVRIDPQTFTIEHSFQMNDYEEPHSLAINRYRDHLFWITDEGIWKMSIREETLPILQEIEAHKNRYRAMLIDHTSDEIYIADGVDGNMQGRIIRYSSAGDKIDQFTVGINPSAFCWEY